MNLTPPRETQAAENETSPILMAYIMETLTVLCTIQVSSRFISHDPFLAHTPVHKVSHHRLWGALRSKPVAYARPAYSSVLSGFQAEVCLACCSWKLCIVCGQGRPPYVPTRPCIPQPKYLLVPSHIDVMQALAQVWELCNESSIPYTISVQAILAGDDYDEEHGYNDRGEHSPMYNVDMDPEDRTAVFDLALEDDSDDGGGLLDWSILAGVLFPWQHAMIAAARRVALPAYSHATEALTSPECSQGIRGPACPALASSPCACIQTMVYRGHAAALAASVPCISSAALSLSHGLTGDRLMRCREAEAQVLRVRLVLAALLQLHAPSMVAVTQPATEAGPAGLLDCQHGAPAVCRPHCCHLDNV